MNALPENLNLFISKHKRANGFDVEEPTLEGSVYPSSVSTTKLKTRRRSEAKFAAFFGRYPLS